MNEEKYEYKANDLNENNERVRIKKLCNEYCFNLGSSRKRKTDVFDNALRLKRFKSDKN